MVLLLFPTQAATLMLLFTCNPVTFTILGWALRCSGSVVGKSENCHILNF